MKTKEQLQTAVAELRAVCAKHEVILLGTCDSEGIYGEIAISENLDAYVGWDNAVGRLSNAVEGSPGSYYVNGIGELACK